MKNSYKIGMVLVLQLVAVLPLFAQTVGGNVSPLQGSIHTYSVKMDDEVNNPIWDLYEFGTSKESIQNGSASSNRYTEGVDYIRLTVNPEKVGGRAYFKIQFISSTGDMPVGGYVIGYTETTPGAQSCITALVLDIHLYKKFDIDVEMNDITDRNDCPDHQDPQLLSEGFQTTVAYKVFVKFPDLVDPGSPYYEDGIYTFKFNIVADGAGAGENATIAGITATSPHPDFSLQANWNAVVGTAVGSSNFTTPVDVTINPSKVTPLVITVVYNHKPGIEQDISFKIFDIIGAFDEPDEDESQPENNTVTHTIWAMPNVGDITAWN